VVIAACDKSVFSCCAAAFWAAADAWAGVVVADEDEAADGLEPPEPLVAITRPAMAATATPPIARMGNSGPRDLHPRGEPGAPRPPACWKSVYCCPGP